MMAFRTDSVLLRCPVIVKRMRGHVRDRMSTPAAFQARSSKAMVHKSIFSIKSFRYTLLLSYHRFNGSNPGGRKHARRRISSQRD